MSICHSARVSLGNGTKALSLLTVPNTALTKGSFEKWNFFFFNWSVVELQCWVSFCCIAKRFSYTHTHTYLFSCSFPWWFITECWMWSPVRYSRNLLVCSKYSRFHLLTPRSYSIPPPTLRWPHIWPLCLWVCFSSVDKFLWVVFWIPHLSDITWYLSSYFWITSLSIISSQSIHLLQMTIYQEWHFF